MTEVPRPSCFSKLYDPEVDDCKKCGVAASCKSVKAMREAKKAGGSKPMNRPSGLRRRIRAFCTLCSPERTDCYGPDCPFYDLRRYNHMTPESWWKLPSSKWEEAAQAALRRRIDAFEASKK